MLFGLGSNRIYYLYDRSHDMIKPHDFGTNGLLVDDAGSVGLLCGLQWSHYAFLSWPSIHQLLLTPIFLMAHSFRQSRSSLRCKCPGLWFSKVAMWEIPLKRRSLQTLFLSKPPTCQRTCLCQVPTAPLHPLRAQKLSLPCYSRLTAPLIFLWSLNKESATRVIAPLTKPQSVKVFFSLLNDWPLWMTLRLQPQLPSLFFWTRNSAFAIPLSARSP